MKPIRIRNFHRIPLLLKLLIVVCFPVCAFFLTAGILHKNIDVSLIGAIPIVITVAGLVLVFNCGIKITSKKVVIMKPGLLKSFDYGDVSYIKIIFENGIIRGEIKAQHQKLFSFCFDGLNLSGGSFFFPHLWMSGLKLSKRFIDRSIKSLSNCEKVKIKEQPS